jgi:sialic acid synthase SpsE
MGDFYFYTETAFHHQGDFAFLKKLVDASKRSGAMGVKFQILIEPASFISTKHGGYNSLSSYCFTAELWEEIVKYAYGLELECIAMPLDMASIQFIHDHKDLIKYIDIHPVSFYDQPLLEKVRSLEIPVIMGVGGRTLAEIQSAYDWFKDQLKVLMVGFQAFPTNLEEIRLGRIKRLGELFPSLQIGYADHSSYNHEHAVISNEYAYLLGATFFEKHISIEEGIERVDYSAAISEEKIKQIIHRIRFLKEHVVDMSDEDIFRFSSSEIKYRDRQKKVVLLDSLPEGTVIEAGHLTTKMIDREGGFYKTEQVIGKRLLRNVEKDDLLDVSSIEA